MPRPRMHHGRPGTRVIPKNWAADHQVVAENTLADGTCVITRDTGAAPVHQPGTGHSVPPAPQTVYEGGCRVQQTNTAEATTRSADEQLVTLTYLVVVPADVAAREGDTVTFDIAADPTLSGRPLTVATVGRGTHRFERDLMCVEDTTRRQVVT